MSTPTPSPSSRLVRTRFAPSPTGAIHIGGVRTAIYAYLLAKRHGGQFLLRVEDTDQERLVPGAIRGFLEELEWYGLTPDEGPSHNDLRAVGESIEGVCDVGGPHGPYIQSLRLEKYQAVAEKLIESGHAYRCDCTAEMIEKERNEQIARKELPGYSGYCRTRNVSKDSKHVIRFKLPFKETVVLDDAVKGRVTWDDIPLKDTILLKSNGFPSYHLAVVVDDTDMQISHVMRGEEWLPSTPIHILLYKALGWEAPVFAHLPSILGKDGKKLSKRDGAVSNSTFRDQGYLPEALFNYLTMVGWSPGEGEEREIFSKEELTTLFSLDHVNKAGGVFDYNKLNWMNGMYIRALSVEEFLKRASPFMIAKGFVGKTEQVLKIAPAVQERVKVLAEVPDMLDFLFLETVTRDMSESFKQGIDKEKAIGILKRSKEVLSAVSIFEHDEIEGALRPLAEEFGVKVGAMLGVLRVGVMGKMVTPPLFEGFAALGKEVVLARIGEVQESI